MKTEEKTIITISKLQAGILAAFCIFLLTGAVAGGLGTWYALGRIEVLVTQHEEELKTLVSREEFNQHLRTHSDQYTEINRSLERIEDRLNSRSGIGSRSGVGSR